MTTPPPSRYAGHRFPPEVISHAIWLYFRFPHSLRMVVSGIWTAYAFQLDAGLAAHGRSSSRRLFGWPRAMALRVAVR